MELISKHLPDQRRSRCQLKAARVIIADWTGLLYTCDRWIIPAVYDDGMVLGGK
jgi:hypothetical protein